MTDGTTDGKAPEPRRGGRAAPKSSNEWQGAADMLQSMHEERVRRSTTTSGGLLAKMLEAIRKTLKRPGSK